MLLSPEKPNCERLFTCSCEASSMFKLNVIFVFAWRARVNYIFFQTNVCGSFCDKKTSCWKQLTSAASSIYTFVECLVISAQVNAWCRYTCKKEPQEWDNSLVAVVIWRIKLANTRMLLLSCMEHLIWPEARRFWGKCGRRKVFVAITSSLG